MTAYLGVDVLTLRPDRPGPQDERLERRRTERGPAFGTVQVAARSAAATGSRAFTFTLLNRAEVAQLRGFVDARRGRTKPFWIPTYQRDLTLAANVAQDATSLSVIDSGYSAKLWPGTGARRHLALYDHNLNLTFVKVTAAAAGTLTVTPAVPLALAAATTVVSFLKLCRLDGPMTVSWATCNLADVTFPVRELPKEAPE